MISHKSVIARLDYLGLKFRFFGRAEVRELANIINPGEEIHHCVYGHYQGGSALLVATDGRLLLIDKRPFFLNLEDIRYEMINEVYFAGRLLDASVKLYTSSKTLTFRSLSDARLRHLCTFTQDQITRARRIDHTVKEGGGEWQPQTLLKQPRLIRYARRMLPEEPLQ